MKITIKPIQEVTTRERKKKITTENGDSMTAIITVHTFRTADKKRRPDPERTVTFIKEEAERTRTNENGGEPTEQEAMNQLEQARTEYEGHMQWRQLWNKP